VTEIASRSSSASSFIRVLIVEDDPVARRAITLILGRLGFATAEATTVAEAMNALSAKPDWILLDLMLPDGDGAEVLRKVTSASPSTRTCVVSGCCRTRLDEARRLGANHVLSKPLEVGRLIELLSD
jgi:CheY-like chemotaxis protein